MSVNFFNALRDTKRLIILIYPDYRPTASRACLFINMTEKIARSSDRRRVSVDLGKDLAAFSAFLAFPHNNPLGKLVIRLWFCCIILAKAPAFSNGYSRTKKAH
jgi:hypothetical protein